MLALLPEDTDDRLQLVPDSGPQGVASVVDFWPILSSDRGELGLLLRGQLQLPQVRDSMDPPIADVLLAFVSQIRELFLLLGGEGFLDLFQLSLDGRAAFLAGSPYFLLLLGREVERGQHFSVLLARGQGFLAGLALLRSQEAPQSFDGFCQLRPTLLSDSFELRDL